MLEFRLGYIDALKYQLVIDYAETTPTFEITLGLNAPEGIIVDAKAEAL